MGWYLNIAVTVKKIYGMVHLPYKQPWFKCYDSFKKTSTNSLVNETKTVRITLKDKISKYSKYMNYPI